MLCVKDLNGSSAQGTVEYLIILAVIIVIALVVVGLFTNIFSSPSQEITESSSKIGNISSGGINVVDAVLDLEGDSLIRISNTSSEALTLEKITVGGVENNFSEQLVGVDSKIFSLSELVSGCSCINGQKSVSCEYVIEYIQNGIEKTDRITKNITCVGDSVSVNPVTVVGLGRGTLAEPWVINSCNELQGVNQHLDGNFILGADINCLLTMNWNGGSGFEPIGSSITPFLGTFNGAYHKISNLYIKKTTNDVGLFGYSKGVISNIGLTDVNIVANSTVSNVGALVGQQNFSTITNSYSTGHINGLIDTGGGLVGYSIGNITNSYSSVTIVGHSSIGGLVGGQDIGTISNCYADGNVTAQGAPISGGGLQAGGLVASLSYGSIINSYSTGHVTGFSNLGGLVGYKSYGTITYSYYDTNTSAQIDTGKGVPKTTVEMKTQNTFEGWDFVNNWLINNDYPILRWQ